MWRRVGNSGGLWGCIKAVFAIYLAFAQRKHACTMFLQLGLHDFFCNYACIFFFELILRVFFKNSDLRIAYSHNNLRDCRL